MQKLGKQVLNTLILTIIVVGLVLGLQQVAGSERFIHPQIWSIVIFSSILGLIIVAINHWGLKTMDAQSRTNLFLGTTVLRLILSMIFIGIMVFTGLEGQIVWVANFFVVYLFFLVFEIYSILSNLRAISREGEKPL